VTAAIVPKALDAAFPVAKNVHLASFKTCQTHRDSVRIAIVAWVSVTA